MSLPCGFAGELPIAYVELHPGAQVTSEDLIRFAAEHIPERPAVPKEIIIMDKLPLTAVGKPIKHLLQVDAARRTFTEALRPVACAWKLDVTHTSGSGLKTSLRLFNATAAARAQAEDILSAFATPYSIEEETPAAAEGR